MSVLQHQTATIQINYISKEDLYNFLYWDHRIYDIRSKCDYDTSHVCRSHHMHPFPNISIDQVFDIDQQIDDDYGKCEHPSDVIIYTNNLNNSNYEIEMKIFECLREYLLSTKNTSNKFLKKINILTDGYESFHTAYPFLCSDHSEFDRCSQMTWPSYITPNIYLGSSICRDETVISMLRITHVLSFSDYAEKTIQLSNIKTLHYQISDSLSTDFLSLFSSIVRWISKSIDDDRGILLIHCEQGVSRSAAIVIAYLLYSNEYFSTVNEAFQFVKSKRGVIRPNQSFMEQLEQYLNHIRTTKNQ